MENMHETGNYELLDQAYTWFEQGVKELEQSGYEVSNGGSYAMQGFALVQSVQTVPNTYGHPVASFIAGYLDGEWIVQRSHSLL